MSGLVKMVAGGELEAPPVVPLPLSPALSEP